MPRKPRNEPPRTTIRWQRRQMAQMEQTIASLRLDNSDKEKVIAGYDVQLSEAGDTIQYLKSRSEIDLDEIGKLQSKVRAVNERLTYLEGYHAKSQETAPRISATGAPVFRDQTQAFTFGRAGNQEGLQTRRQDSAGEGADQGPSGIDPGFGKEVWRERPRDQAYSAGCEVEYAEMTDVADRLNRIWPT